MIKRIVVLMLFLLSSSAFGLNKKCIELVDKELIPYKYGSFNSPKVNKEETAAGYIFSWGENRTVKVFDKMSEKKIIVLFSNILGGTETKHIYYDSVGDQCRVKTVDYFSNGNELVKINGKFCKEFKNVKLGDAQKMQKDTDEIAAKTGAVAKASQGFLSEVCEGYQDYLEIEENPAASPRSPPSNSNTSSSI